MTTVFITFDRPTDETAVNMLLTRGLQPVDVRTDTELWHGDSSDTADSLNAWFSDLPWGGEDTATLIVYGRDVAITTVVIDGELVSTTRADSDGVDVDDWLEDVA